MKQVSWYTLVDIDTGNLKLDYYDKHLLIFESEEHANDYISNWDIQNVKVLPKVMYYD